MSDYKKHILGYLVLIAIIFGILLYFQIFQIREIKAKLEIFLPAVLIGLFYSLLPDIDNPNSKLRSLVAKLSLAIILCCLFIYLLLNQEIKLIFIPLALTFFLYILWFSKHRGIFHSPLAGIFLSIPLYLLNPYFFAFALFGFLSHLVMDGMLIKKNDFLN